VSEAGRGRWTARRARRRRRRLDPPALGPWQSRAGGCGCDVGASKSLADGGSTTPPPRVGNHGMEEEEEGSGKLALPLRLLRYYTPLSTLQPRKKNLAFQRLL
jgi:hypothetical protein